MHSASGVILSITEPFLSTQSGPGPANTEIKTKVLPFRTSQSGGEG